MSDEKGEIKTCPTKKCGENVLEGEDYCRKHLTWNNVIHTHYMCAALLPGEGTSSGRIKCSNVAIEGQYCKKHKI